MAGQLLENRIADSIRHEGGLAYHVDSERAPTAGRSTILTVWAEPGRGRNAAASRTMLDSVSSLLSAGPSPVEMERAREQVLAGLVGRAWVIQSAVEASLSAVCFGSPDAVVEPDLVEAADLEAVATYLRSIAGNVLYLLAEDVEDMVRAGAVGVRGLEPRQPALPASGTVHRPPLPARLLSGEARGVRLVITEDALWLQVGREITKVAWGDAAGVLEDRVEDVTVCFSRWTAQPSESILG